MTDRTTAHRLQVATPLKPASSKTACCPAPASSLPSGPASTRSSPTSAPRTPRCWPSAIACSPSSMPAQSQPRPDRKPAAYRKAPRKIGYSCRSRRSSRCHHQERRCRARAAGRPAAGGADHQCARYALNAANARWGSLHDALYGTDALSRPTAARRAAATTRSAAQKVIEYARYVLDRCVPLKKGSHIDATAYRVVDNNLAVTLKNGTTVGLKNPAQFVGFRARWRHPLGAAVAPRPAPTSASKKHAIGATDAAGVADPCSRRRCRPSRPEDSVAVVDARTRSFAYGNWLASSKARSPRKSRRAADEDARLNPDRACTGPARRGRAAARPLAAVRAQRRPPDDQPGDPVDERRRRARPRDPEGIMDAVVTTTIALHDLQRRP